MEHKGFFCAENVHFYSILKGWLQSITCIFLKDTSELEANILHLITQREQGLKINAYS